MAGQLLSGSAPWKQVTVAPAAEEVPDAGADVEVEDAVERAKGLPDQVER